MGACKLGFVCNPKSLPKKRRARGNKNGIYIFNVGFRDHRHTKHRKEFCNFVEKRIFIGVSEAVRNYKFFKGSFFL
jgi:hypothetical protein